MSGCEDELVEVHDNAIEGAWDSRIQSYQDFVGCKPSPIASGPQGFRIIRDTPTSSFPLMRRCETGFGRVPRLGRP